MAIPLTFAVLALGMLWSRTLARGHGSGLTGEAAILPGQTMGRAELLEQPPPVKPVADRDRITRSLPAGRGYEVLLKGGFVGRLEGDLARDERPRSLAYAYEVLVSRTVESNDGHRVVELRTFKRLTRVKLVAEAEGLQFDLGPPDESALGSLGRAEPGKAPVRVPAQRVVEAILAAGSAADVNGTTCEAFLEEDSLSGKTVRLTYVDGIGVTEIQPIGCTLRRLDARYLFLTAVLSDCHILPDLDCTSPRKWSVDASQLVGFIDPLLRVVPSGSHTVTRLRSPRETSASLVRLRVRDDRESLVALYDTYGYEVGLVIWEGVMKYNLSLGIMETADLDGWLSMQLVPERYFLFGEELNEFLRVSVTYFCRVQYPAAARKAREPKRLGEDGTDV